VGYIMLASMLIGGCLGYGFIWWLKSAAKQSVETIGPLGGMVK
jgi:hypothetical protein